MLAAVSRRVVLGTLAGVATLGLPPRRRARAADANVTVVEDWSAYAPGAHGIPEGWKPYETPGGHPAYDFTIVDDGGHRGLFLKSRDEHSTIARRISVNLAETPMFQWDWKVVELPRGADLRRKTTSDASGHPLLVWPRPPAILRSRLIAYVWDPILPPDTIVKSAKVGGVYFIVVRSGAAELGTWKTERRDVRADYRRAFAEDAPNPEVIALSIDTNDTRAPAACVVGRIAFTAAQPGA
jgi:Protein of unknown function (DUF3047)